MPTKNRRATSAVLPAASSPTASAPAAVTWAQTRLNVVAIAPAADGAVETDIECSSGSMATVRIYVPARVGVSVAAVGDLGGPAESEITLHIDDAWLPALVASLSTAVAQAHSLQLRQHVERAPTRVA